LGLIDVQADMYSLGVVFFELWHPFGTAMERHVVLSDLKQKAKFPPSWVAEFPEQESLLRQLMSPGPSDRPSATELLQNAFPPRMESELVDGKWLWPLLFILQLIIVMNLRSTSRYPPKEFIILSH
jgi:serine/threonine protein kinase